MCTSSNITISGNVQTLSSSICTTSWVIINSSLITNNYNITAGKGLLINKGGSLIQGFVNQFGHVIAAVSNNGTVDIGNFLASPKIINFGGLTLYGNLGSGLEFLNYGNVTLGAVNFLNFTAVYNAPEGIINHSNYLNNGGSLNGYNLCIGGSYYNSYAGSGGGGASSSGCNGGSTLAAGGLAGMNSNATSGSSPTQNLTNFTFNFSLLNSAGGGATNDAINPMIGGSGVRPLIIITYTFTNEGTIVNEGQSLDYSLGGQYTSGAGGGGIVQILFDKGYKNTGVINVSGGRVSDSDKFAYFGGNGGNGKVLVFKVGTGVLNTSNVYPLFNDSNIFTASVQLVNNVNGCLRNPIYTGLHITQYVPTVYGNITLQNQNFPPSAVGLVSFPLYNSSNSLLSYYFYNTGEYNVTAAFPARGTLTLKKFLSYFEPGLATTAYLDVPVIPVDQFSVGFNTSLRNFSIQLVISDNSSLYYNVTSQQEKFVFDLPTGAYKLVVTKLGLPKSTYLLSNNFNCGYENNFTIFPNHYFYLLNGLNMTDQFIYNNIGPTPTVYNETTKILYNSSPITYNLTLNDSQILNQLSEYKNLINNSMHVFENKYAAIFKSLNSSLDRISNLTYSEFNKSNVSTNALRRVLFSLAKIYSHINNSSVQKPMLSPAKTMTMVNLFPSNGQLIYANYSSNLTVYGIRVVNATTQSFLVGNGVRSVQINLEYPINNSSYTSQGSPSFLGSIVSGILAIPTTLYGAFLRL